MTITSSTQYSNVDANYALTYCLTNNAYNIRRHPGYFDLRSKLIVTKWLGIVYMNGLLISVVLCQPIIFTGVFAIKYFRPSLVQSGTHISDVGSMLARCCPVNVAILCTAEDKSAWYLLGCRVISSQCTLGLAPSAQLIPLSEHDTLI